MSNARGGKSDRKNDRIRLTSTRAEVSNIRKHIRSGDKEARDRSLEKAQELCRLHGGRWVRLGRSGNYVRTYGF